MSIWKVPRLTTAERALLTPAQSELIFDTNLNKYFGGDGVTLGGIQFATGGSASIAMIAGAIIGGHRAVVADGTGAVVYADASNIAHSGAVIGITLGAAVLGGPVDVLRSGEITEPTWNWTLGQPIYLGLTGLLTQTPPASPSHSFTQVVAFPATSTRIVVGLREPITLA